MTTLNRISQVSKRRRYFKDHPNAVPLNAVEVKIGDRPYEVRFVTVGGRTMIRPRGRFIDKAFGGREAMLDGFAGKTVKVHHVSNVNFYPNPLDLVHDSEFVPMDELESTYHDGPWPVIWNKVREFAARNQELRAAGDEPKAATSARARWGTSASDPASVDAPPPEPEPATDRPSQLKAMVLAKLAAEDAASRAAIESRGAATLELEALKADVMEAATMGTDREILAAVRIIAERLAKD